MSVEPGVFASLILKGCIGLKIIEHKDRVKLVMFAGERDRFGIMNYISNKFKKPVSILKLTDEQMYKFVHLKEVV